MSSNSITALSEGLELSKQLSIKDSDAYQKAALALESKDYDRIMARIDRRVLHRLFMDLYAMSVIARRLDVSKKELFYGKTMDYPDTEQVLATTPLPQDEQLEAARERVSLSENLRFLHAVLGISTEAGELAELLFKDLFQGDVACDPEVVKEGGDVAWYLALLFDNRALDMSIGLALNLKKLYKRYEGGFTEEAARKHDSK